MGNSATEELVLKQKNDADRQTEREREQEKTPVC